MAKFAEVEVFLKRQNGLFARRVVAIDPDGQDGN